MHRLGVLGGTFDPIHIGHLVLALEACAQRDLAGVVLVPTGDPWQKPTVHASAADRLAMAELAAQDQPQLSVSTVDIDRPGPSYSIDTIRDLHAQHPETDFEFIVGSDALAGLASWQDHEELVSLVTFVVAERPGTPVAFEPGARVESIKVPLLDVSSSDIRSRVALARSVAYLVPDDVKQYLEDHGLYRAS